MADERTESVVLEFSVDLENSVESIDSLTKANRELRKERNAVNLQTAEGKKRAQELNTQIDNNTAKIKDNVSALEKQKINIGNYKSALDGIDPALGRVAGGLEKGTEGLKGMVLQAKAFLLTGIGAAIAALVAVFVLLKTALSQNDALMDKFENVTNAISVVVEVVTARIGKLGEALIALANGNFSEAIDLTAQAFSGLGDEIANAVKQQQLFLDASRKLEDSQIALSISSAKYENEIKRLVVAAKNRNLTFDEQEALLRKAIALEEELVETRTDLARQDLVITARQLRADKEFQQQSNENFDQYIERLLASEKLNGDQKKIIADKIIALEDARASSLAFQEKVENSLTAVQEKRTEAIKKQNEEMIKQELLARNARVSQLDQKLSNKDTPLETLRKSLDKRIELEDNYTHKFIREIAERKKIDEQAAKERTAKFVKANELEIELERGKYEIFASLLSAGQSLVAEDSQAYQVIASAQALINTYLAATAAYASGAKINPLFGALAAAAAVAAGLANVAKINGVEFFNGGYTGHGGKYQPAGTVHKGEVVWNQDDVRLAGGPSAANSLRPTMRGYADGGIVSQSVTQPVNAQYDLMNIVKNLPPQELSVKEVSKIQKRIRVKETISKR